MESAAAPIFQFPRVVTRHCELSELRRRPLLHPLWNYAQASECDIPPRNLFQLDFFYASSWIFYTIAWIVYSHKTPQLTELWQKYAFRKKMALIFFERALMAVGFKKRERESNSPAPSGHCGNILESLGRRFSVRSTTQRLEDGETGQRQIRLVFSSSCGARRSFLHVWFSLCCITTVYKVTGSQSHDYKKKKNQTSK